MIIIDIEKDYIELFLEDRGNSIYSIPKPELAHTRDDNGNQISEWIDHLMSKTWMDDETLYALAKIIQSEHPDNGIDWVETFFPIERLQYIQHVKKLKKLTSDEKKPNSKVDKLFEDLEIGVEEQNEFVNNRIYEIVENKLREGGLI
tara:strand:+ start:70 stop:510 length:441 start_codon:yes stop_codon:yes gene_type:complete